MQTLERTVEHEEIPREVFETIGVFGLHAIQFLNEEGIEDFAARQKLDPSALLFLREAPKDTIVESDRALLGLSLLGLSLSQIGLMHPNRVPRQNVSYHMNRILNEIYTNSPQELQQKYPLETVHALVKPRQVGYGVEEKVEEPPKVLKKPGRKPSPVVEMIRGISPEDDADNIWGILDAVTLGIFMKHREEFIVPSEIKDRADLGDVLPGEFQRRLISAFPFKEIARAKGREGKQRYHFIPRSFMPQILAWADKNFGLRNLSTDSTHSYGD